MALGRVRARECGLEREGLEKARVGEMDIGLWLNSEMEFARKAILNHLWKVEITNLLLGTAAS
jgi:hypothetical protein